MRRAERNIFNTLDYIMEGNQSICVMNVPTPETPEYSRRIAEIVAAPELLAACEAVRKWMGPQSPTDESTVVWRQLNDAIAKARGGAA